MVKAYSKITWINDKPPALNQTNLNKESVALDTVDTRVVELANRVDNMEGFQVAAQEAVDKAQGIADKLQTDANTYRSQLASDAASLKTDLQAGLDDYVNQSKSWAIGEGYPKRTNQATDNSKYYASMAEQAAAEAGFMQFEINNIGHLIYTRTNTLEWLNFEIKDNTNLFAVMSDE